MNPLFPAGLLAGLLVASVAAREPVRSAPYPLDVRPREDATQTDPETGATLLYLTDGKAKDTNLYFHQRSWLADNSVILFVSSRPGGGLMGYVVETGELFAITAADGAKLNRATAAVKANAVYAMAGDRVLAIELALAVTGPAGQRHATVTARERHLTTLSGIDVYLNESCDGRRLVAGGAHLAGATRAGFTVIDTRTGRPERVCDIPEGVAYHGHLQWSITNPDWFSFAGEPNRLWVVDVRQRRPWCPYPQQPNELVTHESWWVHDQLIFCGGIHPKPTEDSHVKVIDMHAGTVRIVGEGSWWPDASPRDIAKRNWWHAAGSADGRWIVADNWHGDIMLFDGKTSRPHLLTSGHRTYGQGEHPEVGWDRRGQQVIFASHRHQGVTVCVATIPPAWQEDLTRLNIGAPPRR